MYCGNLLGELIISCDITLRFCNSSPKGTNPNPVNFSNFRTTATKQQRYGGRIALGAHHVASGASRHQTGWPEAKACSLLASMGNHFTKSEFSDPVSTC